MSTTRNGTCVCGAIQITVTGDPEIVVMCHCSDCQKNAGAPYQLSARYPSSSIKITQGEENLGKWTTNKTASGKEKHKVFSTCCGCTLWTVPMVQGGGKWVVRTAILENGFEDFAPTVEFFTRRRPGYLQAARGTKEFPAYL